MANEWNRIIFYISTHRKHNKEKVEEKDPHLHVASFHLMSSYLCCTRLKHPVVVCYFFSQFISSSLLCYDWKGLLIPSIVFVWFFNRLFVGIRSGFLFLSIMHHHLALGSFRVRFRFTQIHHNFIHFSKLFSIKFI